MFRYLVCFNLLLGSFYFLFSFIIVYLSSTTGIFYPSEYTVPQSIQLNNLIAGFTFIRTQGTLDAYKPL